LDYIEILVGIILTLILSMVLGVVIGALGSYTGFILATLWVGYRVDVDLVHGAINGGLVGILAGIFSIISMITAGALLNMGPGMDLMSFGVFGVIIGLMVDAILGTTGGAIGAYLSTNS
jgi:hypothetical protein